MADEGEPPLKKTNSAKKYYGNADLSVAEQLDRVRAHWDPKIDSIDSNPHLLQV